MHYLAALEKLKKGSKLYLECQSNPSIFHQDLREELKNKGQKPYATIITCSDSRVPVQHIFSSSMGELFIIRNAGNVIGDFEIGSVEYASEHLGVELIVVLGHTHCGAVHSTLHNEGHSYINASPAPSLLRQASLDQPAKPSGLKENRSRSGQPVSVETFLPGSVPL